MPEGKTDEKDFISLTASSFSAASCGKSKSPLSGKTSSSSSIILKLSVMTRPSDVRTHGVWLEGLTSGYHRGLLP